MSATLGQIDSEGRGFSQGMAWIDRSGHLRAPRGVASVDVADRSYVEKVLTTGRPYVSEAIVGRIRSSAVIVFAVPTINASGDVNGVLTGGTRLTDLDLLAPSLEFAGAEIRLVDRDGNLLTGQPASAGPTPVNPSSPYRQMRETGSGLVEGVVGLSGQPDRIIGYATAPTADWLVGLSEPRARAFAGPARARRTELIALLAAARRRDGRPRRPRLGGFPRRRRPSIAAGGRPTVCARRPRPCSPPSMPNRSAPSWRMRPGTSSVRTGPRSWPGRSKARR